MRAQVLMVSPTAFGFNEQTAQDNHFMHESADTGGASVAQQVVREFAALHHQLSEVHGAQHSTQHAARAHRHPPLLRMSGGPVMLAKASARARRQLHHV